MCSTKGIKALFVAIVATLSLALLCYLANYFVYQFPGNNYIPSGALAGFNAVVLLYLGSRLFFESGHRLTCCAGQLCLFYAVISCVALLTNGIQYTPFPAIDRYIISLEQYLNIHLLKLMQPFHHAPTINYCLTIIYESLNYQLVALPLLAIILSYLHPSVYIPRLNHFYLLTLWTAFFGFALYYFFPTTAPASHFKSHLFTQSQYDTGLKFRQLHQYITPTTLDGGMIALPSFHTIWALLCLYLIRPLKWVFYPLCLCNSMLIIACVVLGWHYPSDIIAAFLILGVCHLLMTHHNHKAALG